ncbi:MAG: hypothetical protein AABX72_02540 [Nanoarchaeota archaeon]
MDAPFRGPHGWDEDLTEGQRILRRDLENRLSELSRSGQLLTQSYSDYLESLRFASGISYPEYRRDLDRHHIQMD